MLNWSETKRNIKTLMLTSVRPLSVTIFILQRRHDIVGQVAQPAGHFMYALAHALLYVIQIGSIEVNCG